MPISPPNSPRCSPGRVRPVPVLKGDRVRCMVWNIWHGGRHTGRHVGPQRIVEIMKSIDPDVIGVIETYGSGAILADGMDYQLYLISSNLSILSRYPIAEAIKIFKPFNSGAAAIDFGSGRSMVLNVSWLNSPARLRAQIARRESDSGIAPRRRSGHPRAGDPADSRRTQAVPRQRRARAAGGGG